MAKRGLIVSYYFPPTGGGGVQRWVKLIKYLSRSGWEFSVLASEHPNSGPIDETLLSEIPEQTKIIRTSSVNKIESIRHKTPLLRRSGYWQRWAGAFFRITDSRHHWNSVVEMYIKEELSNNEFDVIIFTLPPYSLSFLAARLGSTIKCPVVLDMRDPWSINPYKIYPTFLHRLLDRQREKKSIARINVVISAYQSTIDDYHKRIENFESKKILILPNGYDENDFTELDTPPSFQGGAFNIGFSGTIYSHLNTPKRLFKVMNRLIRSGIDIHFHHIGASVHDLTKLAKKHNIEQNVHLWGYQSHKVSLQILQMMDALCLILDDRWPQSENTVGGKLYEYLRLKIPVFALVPENGEAAKVIKNTDSGIVVSAKDEAKIAEELKFLLLQKPEFKWIDLEKFNRENQARVLNEFLESIIGES